MQDMIRKIVQADTEAKAMDEANRKNAEEEKRRIEAEAAAIYESYMESAKREIAKNNAYLEKRYYKKWTDITARQASSLIKLRMDYEQNCDRWVDDIVQRVLE
ncbi:hypothetical protein [Lachnoclostridium sp. MSJ-17]|uniref:hypothetical protein n=1 Tax=Lachnoclostridium sp. MSJ-17 TaxID=2841516 RepID=UPI001C0FC8DD|nr:hypothetical protein [Lachnoclostridium sp. MSJ-17]MBU5462901.1 hypothetical protein [Lachnoclostridium sp. MSJ-17]